MRNVTLLHAARDGTLWGATASGEIFKVDRAAADHGGTATIETWSIDGGAVLGIAPRFANAVFAFGNSHFGMSAGPVMGKVACELVTGAKPHIDISAFSPARFG